MSTFYFLKVDAMTIPSTLPVISGISQLTTSALVSTLLPIQHTLLCVLCASDQKAGLTQEEKIFNHCVAHVHACNEHAIGMLKCHWSSLKELLNRI